MDGVHQLLLACDCGRIAGHVRVPSPSAGNRILCYCRDCQAFPRHLGRAATVLDDKGGTDIYQTSQAAVRLTEGRDHIACLWLAREGLLRWYCPSCRTPIANTPATRWMPMTGLIHACLGDAVDGTAKDQVTGPIVGHVFGKWAIGPDRPSGGNLKAVAGMTRIIVNGIIGGDHERSPFFTSPGYQPIAKPVPLTATEREAAYRPD